MPTRPGRRPPRSSRRTSDAYLRREDSPLGVYWTSDGQFLTEMDEERYSELLAALAVDLAKEPSADEEAIFILGSE